MAPPPFGAGDFERAAAAFAAARRRPPGARPTRRRPSSTRGSPTQRLEEWRLALERFRALERDYEGPDAIDA